MTAFILAAGHGTRMGALTEKTPKPLLKAGGACLVEHQIRALANAGHRDIVINVSHLAEQFEPLLGDGKRYKVRLHYSLESDAPLETAGGIRHALPLIDSDTVLFANGDVFTDLDYTRLSLSDDDDACVVLVGNPDFHPDGDFWHLHGRASDGWSMGAERLTFAGIGLYRTSVFERLPDGVVALAPVLRELMDAGRCSAAVHRGHWVSVDTPDRLKELDRYLGSTSNAS